MGSAAIQTTSHLLVNQPVVTRRKNTELFFMAEAVKVAANRECVAWIWVWLMVKAAPHPASVTPPLLIAGGGTQQLLTGSNQ